MVLARTKRKAGSGGTLRHAWYWWQAVSRLCLFVTRGSTDSMHQGQSGESLGSRNAGGAQGSGGGGGGWGSGWPYAVTPMMMEDEQYCSKT